MIPTLETLRDEFAALIGPDALIPITLPAPAAPAPAPAPAVPAAAATLGTASAATPAKPAPAPTVLPPPLQTPEYSARGYHLDAKIDPAQVLEAARILDRHGFAIDAVTGVDWLAQKEMEVVYDFYHPLASLRVCVRARVPREKPEIATISTLFQGANWHERETHDFFGIQFLGHPNLTPFLLPEDATFHPLRKDYAP